MNDYYQYIERIFTEDDGVYYYAAQQFDEEGRDDEIIARGVADTWEEAVALVRQANLERLTRG